MPCDGVTPIHALLRAPPLTAAGSRVACRNPIDVSGGKTAGHTQGSGIAPLPFEARPAPSQAAGSGRRVVPARLGVGDGWPRPRRPCMSGQVGSLRNGWKCPLTSLKWRPPTYRVDDHSRTTDSARTVPAAPVPSP